MNAKSHEPKGRHRVLFLRVWRNPLARAVDRAEALLAIGLAAVWLLSLPSFATIGSVEWGGIEARRAADRSSDVSVDAVVVEDVGLTVAGHEAVAHSVDAHAIWIGRDGRAANGLVRVPAGTTSGDRVPIWLDPQGNVVAEPMTTPTAATLTVLATVGAWVILGLALTAVWWVMRRRIDRSRWKQWDREWAAFPTGHHSP